MKKYIAIWVMIAVLGFGIGAVVAKTGTSKVICPCGCEQVAVECGCEEAIKLLKSLRDA